jgi:surface protein
MKLLKQTTLFLLTAALCVCCFGCGKNNNPNPNPPVQNNNQSILPGFNNPDPKPVTYTPVYATAFGDTIILATVPVEEWHSQESACPAREISNGGRIKCNGEHESEVPITKVIILEDVIPRVCSGWFRDMIHLETIEGLEKLHIHQVSDMSYMFAGCEKLKTLPIDGWDVSQVTDMTDMFKDCISLEELPQWYPVTNP